jgi:hypothetical protein
MGSSAIQEKERLVVIGEILAATFEDREGTSFWRTIQEVGSL